MHPTPIPGWESGPQMQRAPWNVVLSYLLDLCEEATLDCTSFPPTSARPLEHAAMPWGPHSEE